MGANAQEQSDDNRRQEVVRYLDGIYARTDRIVIWRDPIKYNVHGLDEDAESASSIHVQIANFSKVTQHPIYEVSTSSPDVNMTLIFSPDPASLATDPGFQAIFLGLGKPQSYSAERISAFQKELSNLVGGGWLTRFFLSEDDVVFFAAVAHANLLKGAIATEELNKMLFNAISHAEGNAPEGLPSIASTGPKVSTLQAIDNALLRALYDLSRETARPVQKADLVEPIMRMVN